MRQASDRALRGALAGGVAGAVWLLQEPLDRRVFDFPYSDGALLGQALTGGPLAGPLGAAVHVQTGAVFGAAYATARPHLPAALARHGWAAGLAAGIAEHLVSWPAVRLADRHHPRRTWPALAGDRRAFAQATWRHALFGVLLGVLEAQLNRAPAAPGGDPAQNGRPSGVPATYTAPVAPE